MGGTFFLNVRFQLSAAIVLAVIAVNYFGKRRIKLYSANFFAGMLICACLNILFDITTVYTISHMDTVPAWLNRLAHQLFIGSLNTMLYFMFMYVSILGRKEKRMQKLPLLIVSVPYIVSMCFVIFGELNYYVNGSIVYSYGPMAYALYACVAAYMLLANIRVIRFRHDYKKDTRRAILNGTGFWIIIAVTQYCFPGLLLSGLSAAVMMLHLYLSLEDPSEHIDNAANCFNRHAFELMLNERLGKRKAFVIVNVVIDDISTLNTKFGFTASKALMCKLSDELREISGADVCHYRGNSLLFMLPGNSERAWEPATRIQARAASPFMLQRIDLGGRYHIDIIECPKLGDSVDSICKLIDYMLEAKASPDVIRIAGADEMEHMKRSLAVEALVEHAIEHDGFDVYYQPIYNTNTHTFNTAEALLRLKDRATLGYVSPDEFVLCAERRGLISKIGEIVLDKVCAMAARESLFTKGIEYIEVNLSGIQASEPGLADTYAAIMAKYAVPASFLNFEITETAAVEAGDVTRDNMHRFKKMGCSFSIDDFGTGYSNLAQLAKMEYMLLKLDKSLIWPCFDEDGERSQVILESIVTMTKRLGKSLVAEGVETQEQADELERLKVCHLQGYLFSRPLPESAYIEFLKDAEKK